MSNLHPDELSILLVEPSDTQRKIISNQLKDHGITQLVLAKNITEAFNIVKRQAPDLIISAMYFEDGTALELLRNIRAEVDREDSAFMLVTSEDRKERLEEFKQSGVIALLPKPFTPANLDSAINTTIDLLSVDEMELEYFDVHELRVLLVDDSKLARHFISRVLNNLGLLNITEAVNGKQAINLIQDNMYDLLVTDYNMPEVDGRELTQYIRKESQQPHLPILMVTSMSQEAHLANIEQAGVNALCNKPFEPEIIKQILYKLLDG